MLRSIPRFGTGKKFYEDSAVFSKYLSQESIDKVFILSHQFVFKIVDGK